MENGSKVTHRHIRDQPNTVNVSQSTQSVPAHTERSHAACEPELPLTADVYGGQHDRHLWPGGLVMGGRWQQQVVLRATMDNLLNRGPVLHQARVRVSKTPTFRGIANNEFPVDLDLAKTNLRPSHSCFTHYAANRYQASVIPGQNTGTCRVLVRGSLQDTRESAGHVVRLKDFNCGSATKQLLIWVCLQSPEMRGQSRQSQSTQVICPIVIFKVLF